MGNRPNEDTYLDGSLFIRMYDPSLVSSVFWLSSSKVSFPALSS
jgi:hypothetical protein